MKDPKDIWNETYYNSMEDGDSVEQSTEKANEAMAEYISKHIDMTMGVVKDKVDGTFYNFHVPFGHKHEHNNIDD